MDPMAKRSLQCPNCGASVSEDCLKCDYCHSVLTVTSCPSCFGAVFKGMKFCPACGAAVEREKAESHKDLACPRCEKIMAPAMIGSTRINECANCGGIWLDTQTFQNIVDDKKRQEKVLVYPVSSPDALQQSAEPPARMYVPCPECGSLMQRRNFLGCSGIIVDWCKDHGTWFDHRELQQIVNFIQNGGLQKARKKEIVKLEDEQKRLRDLQFEQEMDRMRQIEQDSFHHAHQDGLLAHFIGSFFGKLL